MSFDTIATNDSSKPHQQLEARINLSPNELLTNFNEVIRSTADDRTAEPYLGPLIIDDPRATVPYGLERAAAMNFAPPATLCISIERNETNVPPDEIDEDELPEPDTDERINLHLEAMFDDPEQEELAEILHALWISETERENRAAERILEMLSSVDPAEVAAGDTLSSMLLSGNHRNDAITIAGALDTVAHTMQLLEMHGETIGTQIIEMLSDPERRAWVGPLLDRFRDPNLGLDSLSGGGGPNRADEQLAELFNDPDQQELAFELYDLINSEDEHEAWAGRHILLMMSSDDGTHRYAGATLGEMLLDPQQRENSLAIAGPLSDMQIQQLFALSGDRAYPRLLEMLRNQEQREQVVALMNLLTSEHEADRTDGRQLLNILAGDRPQDTRQILGIFDPDHAHQLTLLIANPYTAEGGRQILNLRTSENAHERAIAREFLDSMESADAQTIRRNSQLLQMLSSELTRSDALTFMQAFRYNQEKLGQAIDLAQRDPQTAGLVADLLRGSAQERQAAENLINRLANDAPGRGRMARGSDQPAVPPERSTTAEVTNMLRGDAAQRQRAVTLLNNLPSDQVGTFMEISRQYPAAANGIVQAIEGGHAEAVRSLLELQSNGDSRPPSAPNSGRNPNTDRAVADYFLQGLNNPETRATFQNLLDRLDSPQEFRNMQMLISTPAYRQTADTITQMLADPRGAADAHRMLANLSPPQMHTITSLLQEGGATQQQARQLMRLISEGNGGMLLYMLASNQETTRQAGQDLFRSLTNDRTRDDAQRVIANTISPEQARLLWNSLRSPETAAGARQILRRLDSEDEEVRQDARRFMNRLTMEGSGGRLTQQWMRMMGGSPEERHRAQLLMSTNSWDVHAEMLDILNTNAPEYQTLRQQAAQIIDNSQPDSPQFRNLIGVLTPAANVLNRRGDNAGESLVRLLNDPQRQAQASAILSTARSPEQARDLIQLTAMQSTRGAAEQAARMLQSGDAAQVRAAENWLRAMNSMASANMDADIAPMNAMLTDARTREQATGILSGLENGTQIGEMFALLRARPESAGVQTLVRMLNSGDRNQIAAARSFLDLRAQERGQADKASESRNPSGSREPAPPPSDQILSRLENPSQAAQMRELLGSVSNSLELSTLFGMLQDPVYAETAMQIAAALRDSERQSSMRSALSRISNPFTLRQLMSLSANPNNRAAISEINSILNDPQQSVSGVFNLLNLLGSPDQARRQVGQQLLNMLNSQIEDLSNTGRELVNSELGADDFASFLTVYNNPAHGNAAREIMTLIRDDSDSARNFLTTLRSQDARERERAQRQLSLLNSWSSSGYAIRSIQNATTTSGRKG